VEYLTTAEYAELKNCSERYIQKLIKTNKLECIEKSNPANGHYYYLIPVSALPENLQEKYYRKQKADAGLLPEKKPEQKAKPEKPKPPQRSFEQLSDEERQQVTEWTEILNEWQAMRSQYPKSKTEFDKLYIGKCQLEHPNMKISESILYRKYSAFRDGNTEGLLDRRGTWSRGTSTIPEPVWEMFRSWWMDENLPSVSLCYRSVIIWTEEFYPELVSQIPNERTFRRRIDRDIAEYLRTCAREGEKAFTDRCAPYIMRDYSELEANDCWIADTHTLDIISKDGTVKHRLYLTAFLDAKSGILTGWNIAESASSDSVRLALRNGIQKYGIPKCIYVDNGREYVNHQLGGRGHRTKKNESPASEPPPIFKRLGIEMRNAEVRRARTKPIERTFRIVKEQFSKLWTGFCGGTILEKPESLKQRIKSGQIPCDYEIREMLGTWIDGEYNQQPYGGRERCFKGMSRMEVWSNTLTEIRKPVSEEDLNLLLMKTTRKQKVKRNGVSVTISGEEFWFYDKIQTLENLRREVYARYDPADFRTARIYDAETDRFLFEWKLADILMVNYLEKNQETVADANANIRAVKKYAHQQKKRLRKSGQPSLLDMQKLRMQAKLADGLETKAPEKITLIQSGEELPQKKAVGAENLSVQMNLDRMRENYLKLKQQKGNE